MSSQLYRSLFNSKKTKNLPKGDIQPPSITNLITFPAIYSSPTHNDNGRSLESTVSSNPTECDEIAQLNSVSPTTWQCFALFTPSNDIKSLKLNLRMRHHRPQPDLPETGNDRILVPEKWELKTALLPGKKFGLEAHSWLHASTKTLQIWVYNGSNHVKRRMKIPGIDWPAVWRQWIWSARGASETEIMYTTDPMMINERRNRKWAQARQGRPREGWLVGSCLTMVKSPTLVKFISDSLPSYASLGKVPAQL